MQRLLSNWPQGLMSKDLQFCLEFHPKGYLFQFVFDQHESTKHVKLDGFQDGLWVRALRNTAAKKLLVLLASAKQRECMGREAVHLTYMLGNLINAS